MFMQMRRRPDDSKSSSPETPLWSVVVPILALLFLVAMLALLRLALNEENPERITPARGSYESAWRAVRATERLSD